MKENFEWAWGHTTRVLVGIEWFSCSPQIYWRISIILFKYTDYWERLLRSFHRHKLLTICRDHLDLLWFSVMLLLVLFCLEHLWSHLFSKICRWDISQHEQWVERIACCWTFHTSFDPWGFTLLLFLFHLIQLYFSVSSRKANNYSLVIFFGYSDKLL